MSEKKEGRVKWERVVGETWVVSEALKKFHCTITHVTVCLDDCVAPHEYLRWEIGMPDSIGERGVGRGKAGYDPGCTTDPYYQARCAVKRWIDMHGQDPLSEEARKLAHEGWGHG